MIAVGLLRRDDGALLVTEGRDPQTGESWHRLIGGGVAHGEPGAAALMREFAEEYGIVVEVGERLAALENLFTYDGAPGHELVLVYETRLTDPTVAEGDRVPAVEPGQPPAAWVPPSDARLVPPALAALVNPE